MSPGPLELGIVLLIALLVFGPKRLPGLGKQLGTGMREFKDGITGSRGDKDGDNDGDEDAAPPAIAAAPVAAPATAPAPAAEPAVAQPAPDASHAEDPAPADG